MLVLNKTGDFFVCCNQSHGPGGNQEVVLLVLGVSCVSCALSRASCVGPSPWYARCSCLRVAFPPAQWE